MLDYETHIVLRSVRWRWFMSFWTTYKLF